MSSENVSYRKFIIYVIKRIIIIIVIVKKKNFSAERNTHLTARPANTAVNSSAPSAKAWAT